MEDQTLVMDEGVNGMEEPVETGDPIFQDSLPESEDSLESQEIDKNLENQIRTNLRGEYERKYQSKLQDYETRISEYDEKYKGADEAINFINILKQDPAKLKAVIEVIEGPKEPEMDPYAEWDEDAASKFREVDDLKRRLEQYEKKEAEREQSFIERQREQAQLSAEDEYFNLLVKDGYIEEGNNLVSNIKSDPSIRTLTNAVLTELVTIAKDPDAPTKKEVNLAYKNACDGLSLLTKKSMKRRVTRNVPPTGSKNGQPAVSKPSLATEEDRLKFLMQKANI